MYEKLRFLRSLNQGVVGVPQGDAHLERRGSFRLLRRSLLPEQLLLCGPYILARLRRGPPQLSSEPAVHGTYRQVASMSALVRSYSFNNFRVYFQVPNRVLMYFFGGFFVITACNILSIIITSFFLRNRLRFPEIDELYCPVFLLCFHTLGTVKSEDVHESCRRTFFPLIQLTYKCSLRGCRIHIIINQSNCKSHQPLE